MQNDPVDPTHFNQKPRRKAEYIMPPNLLKAKTGSGGLGEEILRKAELLLEKNTVDFLPLAEIYLNTLQQSIEKVREADSEADRERLVATMIYPAMQLKANGGMFRFPLVTTIADRLVQFLEVIATPDIDAIEIILAFHTAIRAIVMGRITGDGGRYGRELLDALDSACTRYLERYPENGRR